MEEPEDVFISQRILTSIEQISLGKCFRGLSRRRDTGKIIQHSILNFPKTGSKPSITIVSRLPIFAFLNVVEKLFVAKVER